MERYDMLKLENQLCFPLYAAAKEVVRKYRQPLAELGLTYTQYIVMMVLWEDGPLGVKELGERLFLDSGTLTPLLKKLEKAGYVTRRRNKKDERNLVVSVTESGEELRKSAVDIPLRVGSCIPISLEEFSTLYKLLYKILNQSGKGQDNEFI